MKKHRGTKKQRTGLALMLYELLFSGGVLIVLSMLAAFILSSLKNPTANLKLFSLAVLLISAVISGYSISKHNGNALSSIAVSAAFVGIMFIVSLIFAKGNVGGGVFMNYLCYMLVAAFFAFIGRKREKRRHRR